MGSDICSGIDFNPRSYKRSDAIILPFVTLAIIISIHAPTRGATLNPFFFTQYRNISIHAPTRGATTKLFGRSPAGIFQSTLLQEERLTLFQCYLLSCHISIHAPTRGATAKFNKFHFVFQYSLVHITQIIINIRNCTHQKIHYNTFFYQFCGTNTPGFSCSLQVRTMIYCYYTCSTIINYNTAFSIIPL
jgi:hypothetical protein